VGSESTRWSQIRGAAAGQPVARDGFVQSYEPVLRAYLLARWGGGPLRPEVDDAVQDVFVECFRAGGALEKADPTRGSFRAFLYGLARNIARRHEEKQGGRREGQAPSPSAFEAVPVDEDSVSHAFERAWARSVMRQAAERQAVRAHEGGAEALKRVELLRLRFEEGVPIRDIAVRWGADPAWVHHEYARARREFRAAVTDVLTDLEPDCAPDAEGTRLLALLRQDGGPSARKPGST
jgi:RNA polymerase sigma factor (sigma-70 family)